MLGIMISSVGWCLTLKHNSFSSSFTKVKLWILSMALLIEFELRLFKEL